MDTNSYFTIEILSAGNLYINKSAADAPDATFYYWVNTTPNAAMDNYTGSITTTTAAQYITISVGDKIKFYRAESTRLTANEADSGGSTRIRGTAGMKFSGNLASLINFSESIPTYCFRYLFYQANVIDISNLEFPWSSLSAYCFIRLFQGCSALEKGPTLKHVNLASRCYQWMFINCTNLSSITCLQKNPDNNFNNWLSGVAATGVFIKDKDTTWPSGATGIPSGWTIKNINQDTRIIDFSNVGAVKCNGGGNIIKVYGQNNTLLWEANS